jgi:hypothetical protein
MRVTQNPDDGYIRLETVGPAPMSDRGRPLDFGVCLQAYVISLKNLNRNKHQITE